MKSIKINKTKITLVSGDITKQKTDAIVNAANSNLLGGGGVDGAIHKAGGQKILAECKKIVAKQGKCETGEAVITTGGNLKAKSVIHTVGPVWQGGDSNEAKLLANCYANSLTLAMENGLETISFPAISTGVYGYPIVQASQIALKTAIEFVRENSFFEEVVFVLYSKHDYDVYEYTIDEIAQEKGEASTLGDKVIADYLSNIEFGEIQQFRNMAIIPLFDRQKDSPEYLTLKSALEEKLLTVTEVSSSGSVPELQVTNNAKIPVLLLDGEELAGAKQNRVLNTTILLKEKSETVIPVSCTEQGRWSYKSREFADSDVVASPRLRMHKSASVTRSLNSRQKFESDQSEVWNVVHEMSEDAQVRSPTSAMKDVYESKTHELEEYLESFKSVSGQKGLLVFINGEVAGLDAVSLDSAYKILQPKLLKSYAMDALLQRGRENCQPSVDKAKAFLDEAMTCEENKYESIGYGWDYRFKGETIVGSALVYRENVIHAAFFRTTETDQVGRMSGYRRRREFRV